jgi:outer membrane protein assembly factor BamB
MYAVDAKTGEEKWVHQGAGYSSPWVGDGVIYFGGTRSAFCALQ